MKNNKIYEYDYSFFESKNKFFYYFIGLMASDGNVKNDLSMSLGLSNDYGKKLIEDILLKIKSNHKIYHKKKSYKFQINDKRLIKILSEYNIVPRKTLTYELPNLTDYELKYFIQGYIDGDGSIGIYNNGNNVEYLSISIVGTENFIKSLNDKIEIKGNIRKIKKCTNLYELRFYGKKAVDFGFYLYDDICFDYYKYQLFKKFISNDKYGKKYMKYYDLKNIVIQELKNGETKISLAKKYKINYSTINSWCRRNII